MVEEKKKNNKKRKISIITVFLWLLLIVTMSVITIGSIRRQNAVENPVDKVTIKLDMSEIDEEILSAYSSMIESKQFILSRTNSNESIPINFIQKENKVYTYELETVPTKDIELYMSYFDFYEDGKLLENKIRDMFLSSYKEIKVEDLQSEYIFKVRGEKLEVNVLSAQMITTNLEFNNITNIEELPPDFAYVSPLINVGYENGQERYIGIRTSQAKSIMIGSNLRI